MFFISLGFNSFVGCNEMSTAPKLTSAIYYLKRLISKKACHLLSEIFKLDPGTNLLYL